ncbi:MAG: PilZ domain-containing protein [Bdellovibrionaceae bacterium]|nr:PilZ domain-containing protein [Pseudobdellovibrionaceae bacterium]
MKDNGNVIELRQGKRKKALKQVVNKRIHNPASVTDISELRKEIINDERRRVKRTILTEFIGANVIVPGQGLVKVALYDISEGGLAFDLEEHMGQFKIGEKIAMRVYMNSSTYFPFIIEITHSVFIPEEQVNRMGASFVKDSINKEALHHFVKFIETVSANLRSDDGDVMVSNIK